MLDLLVRGGTLADGRTGIDIAVLDGRIVEMRPGIAASVVREIDAAGHLVAASFVDAHFHLDATLALGFDGHRNESGTLAEGIGIWNIISSTIPADDFRRRALA